MSCKVGWEIDQKGVQTAILNSNIEEEIHVYMRQPKGYKRVIRFNNNIHLPTFHNSLGL